MRDYPSEARKKFLNSLSLEEQEKLERYFDYMEEIWPVRDTPRFLVVARAGARDMGIEEPREDQLVKLAEIYEDEIWTDDFCTVETGGEPLYSKAPIRAEVLRKVLGEEKYRTATAHVGERWKRSIEKYLHDSTGTAGD